MWTERIWRKKKSSCIEIPLKAHQLVYRIGQGKQGWGKRTKRQIIVKAGQVKGSLDLLAVNNFAEMKNSGCCARAL